MSEAAGKTIGTRYVLADEIAAGGMATVHFARQIGAAGFARTVAVKRLHSRYARDPAIVAMLVDEARMVSRIRHPNVVQAIDVVAENNELFLVMEYVHGESLSKLLRVTALGMATMPLPIAAGIVVGALRGLHEAHEARTETGEPLAIVHRDVSPQNILVGVDGITRVIDFGVASANVRMQNTQQGHLKGKLSYMAPEQVLGARLDRRTDVYAAAVVLWEMLTGAKLSEGANEAALVHRILNDHRRPPSDLNRDVPTNLDAIVLRGLSRDPALRFPTACEMALAIEAATPIASPSEIGAWVLTTCATTIHQRARIIAGIEARFSSQNIERAAASLRTISSSTPQSLPSSVESSATPARVVRYPRPLLPIALAACAIAACGAIVLAVLLRRTSEPEETVVVTTTLASSPPPTTAPPCPPGMLLVPGGRFFMGSDDALPDEKPAHNVTVGTFCMDRFEVTAEAYRTCSDRGDCKRAATTNKWDGITARDAEVYDPICNAGVQARASHPINCVDWAMADRYCKANEKRLPTEAEWEFAARGSDGRKFPWGDEEPSATRLNACGLECNTWMKRNARMHDGLLYAENDGFETTAPVGSFPLGRSRWGVEDITGNVWEWVSDWHGPYTSEDETNPRGPNVGKTRIVRGGAWNGAYADWVRPSFRYHLKPDTRSHGVGFRCVK